MPILAAIYIGDAAEKLLAAGAAVELPPDPAAGAAAAAAAAAQAAAPAGGGDGGPPAEAPPAPKRRALVTAPAVPEAPSERPDDEAWVLPEPPEQIVWRHPAPAAGLLIELLEARGRAWPTRVRVSAADDVRVATLSPLDPLPPGAEFRLVARVLADDGSAHVWTEPLKVRRPEPTPEPAAPPR